MALGCKSEGRGLRGSHASIDELFHDGTVNSIGVQFGEGRESRRWECRIPQCEAIKFCDGVHSIDEMRGEVRLPGASFNPD